MSSQTVVPRKVNQARGARLAVTRKQSSPLKKILIAFSILVVVTIAAALVYGMAVYDKIYPNVSVDGVALGGRTLQEAERLLEERLANRYGASLTLTVAGERTVLTPDEVGLRFAETPAELAWNFGREGDFFERMGDMLDGFFGEVELSSPDEPIYSIDKPVIQSVVEDIARQVDIPMVAPGYEIDGKEIRLKAGVTGRTVDREKLTGMLWDSLVGRFEMNEFSDLYYEPQVVSFTPVDIKKIFDETFVEPIDARFDFSDPESRNDVVILPEKEGWSFDLDEAKAAYAATPPGETLTIELKAIPPAVTAAQLQSQLFADTLASFSTSVGGTADRVSNIRLAASFIDGTILLPGDEFSFNGVVGQRTISRGFKMAGAYINGELVDDVGGGVCQMSTTTYGAALRADMEITERRCHSMTVGYVPLGQDATVDWGSTDFKFRNNNPYPVKILANQSNGRVSVTIMGNKVNDYTVDVRSAQTGSTPPETKTVVNNALKPGERVTKTTGKTGYSAVSWRVYIYPDGRKVENEEARSKYNKVDYVIEVGPDAPPTSNPPPASDPPPTQPPATNPPPTQPPPEPDTPEDAA